jgi:hypothetical protein
MMRSAAEKDVTASAKVAAKTKMESRDLVARTADWISSISWM